MFPIAAGYVADTLPERRQAQGMAWLNASAALGVVAGPVVGGLSTRQSRHWDTALGHVVIHGFAAPFLALAAMSGLMIVVAWRWQPESSSGHESDAGEGVDGWMAVGHRTRGLLALVVASQVAMALFMTAFALYADARLNFGPQGIGAVFALCGLITASVQIGAFWLLARRWGEWTQIGMGFGAMGVGIAVIPLAPSLALVMVAVGVFVVGAAVVAPSLLSLSAKQNPHSVGTAAGLLGSATYLGQAIGPFAASALFVWDAAAPFYATGALMLTAAAWLAWSIRSGKRDEQVATL
jgi:DHA1 family multidrug resistance protein-like MFS transporter